MSDSLASSEIISKPIGAGVRRGDAVFKRRMPMRFSLIAAVLPALFVCNGAMAQVSGMAAPTPTMGATSPLGLGMGSSVSPTGIPMGATEIASPGVSPMPTSVTGAIAMPGSGTTCSTAGTSPSGMYGSTATYDGGGTAAGAAMPATAATSGATAMSATSTSSGISATSGMPTTSGMPETSGMSGMCGSGSSSIASSSTPTSTSPTTPGGAARTGIPLGSMEISNLGVSSAPAVPTTGVLPIVGAVGPSPLAPTMTTVSPTTSPTTTSSNPACATTGTIGAGGIGSFAGAGNAGVTGTSIGARTLRQFILCQR